VVDEFELIPEFQEDANEDPDKQIADLVSKVKLGDDLTQ